MKRLLVLVVVLAGLLAPSTASAAWYTRSWNVRWPSQGFAWNYTLSVPSRYYENVSVDSVPIGMGNWTYLACGTSFRSSRARYSAQLSAYGTMTVFVTLKSGWLCGEFPHSGMTSQISIDYWH